MTNSPVENQIYAGWLYAAVSNTDSTLNGIFMTKDFGQNWVQVRIPTLPPVTGYHAGHPQQRRALGDYNVLGTQGNYDIALAVDPTNPNVIYLGGQHAPNTGTGMVRVDTTAIWDAHNLTLRSDVANDGAIDLSSTGPVTIGAYPPNPYTEYYPPFLLTDDNYLNFIRNPHSPFDSGSTLFVYNLGQFTNNGFGATWTPFDVSGTDYHRFFTMIDPTTGLPRIVFGNDQGVWSVIDDHGVQLAGQGVGTQPTPSMDRNGNLQITQFYYGAVQPSNTGVAAVTTRPCSTAVPRTTAGHRRRGTSSRPGTSTGTDRRRRRRHGSRHRPARVGTRYQTFWPETLPQDLGTSFFLVNHIGRTFGLFQQSGGSTTPDPQWPLAPAANFAVNPINGNQMIISSGDGSGFLHPEPGRDLVRDRRSRRLRKSGRLQRGSGLRGPDRTPPEASATSATSCTSARPPARST